VVQTVRAIPPMINSPYVFYTNSGERRRQLPKGWEGYLIKAEIQNFRWHDLRHTFASRLVMKGVPLYTVQGLLGHSTAEMTRRYAHLAPEYMANSVNLLCQGIELPSKLPPAALEA
jgi:site-specific recombinase XerD